MLDLLLAYELKIFFKSLKVGTLLKPFETYLNLYPGIDSAKGLIVQTGKNSTKKMLFKAASMLKKLLKDKNSRSVALEFFINFFQNFVSFFLTNSLYQTLQAKLLKTLVPATEKVEKEFSAGVTDLLDNTGVGYFILEGFRKKRLLRGEAFFKAFLNP
jgi:hypothetical protein